MRFVDLSAPEDPHIQECFVSFLCLQRATATNNFEYSGIASHESLSLDPSNIRGQAYDGASVISSGIGGVQAKIKAKSPLARYTHCYCHCLSLSIADCCKVQEVKYVLGVINECLFFLEHSPKRQCMFELTVSMYLPESAHTKLQELCKTRWKERHTCFDLF